MYTRLYDRTQPSGVAIQLPSIDVLHGFLAAAQTLNFRRAARQVALTPAALGRRIQLLEELCGAALFHRTTRSVTRGSIAIARSRTF
jgi:LysR family transcriptional regulator, glycine cleavage system transcriptional activator